MIRQLRSVKTDDILGEIAVNGGGQVTYQGEAGDVLSKLVARDGPDDVMKNGWSNGYLYLAGPIGPG